MFSRAYHELNESFTFKNIDVSMYVLYLREFSDNPMMM